MENDNESVWLTAHSALYALIRECNTDAIWYRDHGMPSIAEKYEKRAIHAKEAARLISTLKRLRD